MHILYITPSYYPHIGGVEYVVKSVAERLVRIGHEIVVIAGEPEIERPREEEINSVKIIRWPVWSPGEAYHYPRRRDDLRRLLREIVRDVDIVHIHSVHTIFTMYSLKILKDLGVKIVVTPYYHGTGHTFFRRFLWIFWRRYVKNLLGSCVVHTVSKFEAEIVERDFGVKAVSIENGVEEWIRDLKWDPKNYVFYSGRIERYKNIDLLAKIVKILNKRYGLDLMLKVLGKGSYRERLEKSLKDLGIYYEISDFKPFEEYIKYLSHSMFFGLLSEKESYPQSVNEANAIGVPTVVAKPWGLNFRDRRRTLIIDLRKNLDAMADEIYSFLRIASEEDKSLVPTWSEVAQKYIKKLYSDQI